MIVEACTDIAALGERFECARATLAASEDAQTAMDAQIELETVTRSLVAMLDHLRRRIVSETQRDAGNEGE
jgi:hypothetical protein